MASASLKITDQGDNSISFSVDLAEFDQGEEPTPAVMIAVTTKALFDAELLEPFAQIVLDAIVHGRSPSDALRDKVHVSA